MKIVISKKADMKKVVIIWGSSGRTFGTSVIFRTFVTSGIFAIYYNNGLMLENFEFQNYSNGPRL